MAPLSVRAIRFEVPALQYDRWNAVVQLALSAYGQLFICAMYLTLFLFELFSILPLRRILHCIAEESCILSNSLLIFFIRFSNRSDRQTNISTMVRTRIRKKREVVSMKLDRIECRLRFESEGGESSSKCKFGVERESSSCLVKVFIRLSMEAVVRKKQEARDKAVRIGPPAADPQFERFRHCLARSTRFVLLVRIGSFRVQLFQLDFFRICICVSMGMKFLSLCFAIIHEADVCCMSTCSQDFQSP